MAQAFCQEEWCPKGGKLDKRARDFFRSNANFSGSFVALGDVPNRAGREMPRPEVMDKMDSQLSQVIVCLISSVHFVQPLRCQ